MIGWLLTATQDGATRLQAIVMVMALIEVIYMWVGMIKDGLEVEQNEQSKN